MLTAIILIAAALVAALLAVVNAFVDSRESYTAGVPTGLALSFVVVVLMLSAIAPGWRSPRPDHSVTVLVAEEVGNTVWRLSAAKR